MTRQKRPPGDHNRARRELGGWLAARRHAVPAQMAAESAARRAAGDWRGACAAARIDVAVDLAATADRHGRDLADAVADDLAHLAPDLLRWHLPRRAHGGVGPLQPGLCVPLALYRAPLHPPAWRADPSGIVALRVRTPVAWDAAQRLVLELGPSPYGGRLVPDVPERWDETPFRWDVRAVDGLREHLGGGDRVPFHHGDGRRLAGHELPTTSPTGADPAARTEWITLLEDRGQDADAWAALGADVEPDDIALLRDPWWRQPELPVSAAVLLPAVRRHLARHGSGYGPEFRAVPAGAERGRQPGAVVLAVTRRGTRSELHTPAVAAAMPLLPDSWCRRSPDLELLRHGLLDPSAMHPLVRAAMFPHDPDAGRPEAYRPAAPDPGTPARVRCATGWHRIAWRDGRLTALDHDGRPAADATDGCAAVTRAWRGGRRVPRAVEQIRLHLVLAALHGDDREVRRLLDAGVDPVGVRDRQQRNLLHLSGRIGRTELVGRLVAAGVGLEDGDFEGRTPLLAALADDAAPEVVRALLDAGADPRSRDDHGSTALHLVRCREVRTVLPRLLDAGLDLEAPDGQLRAPLIAALDRRAPVEVVRALLDAGARPVVSGRYARTMDQIIDRGWGAGGLPFLRLAAARAG